MKNNKAINRIIVTLISLLFIFIVLVFLNNNLSFKKYIDKFILLPITSILEKPKENKVSIKTTYFLPEDAPIILDKNSPKNIEIIGSFTAKNEKKLGDSDYVIKIENGYKGNLFFGNIENIATIIIKNPKISILSVEGSGDNFDVSTYVKLKGSFNFISDSANDNEIPVIEVKPGALLFLDQNENTTIKSSKTRVVIGGKKGEDAGHIIINKSEKENNVFLIQGGHIGSGENSFFSGTIFSNDGDTPLRVKTIGGYLKTPDSLRKNLVMLLPSETLNIDKIDLININNYLIFDYADNVTLNNIEPKNLFFESNGDGSIEPYTYINSENTSLVTDFENILMEEDKNIIKPIRVKKNINYVYAISSGDVYIKPKEQSTHTFDEISLNIACEISEKILITAHEFYTNLEIKEISVPILSGYTREKSIECGTILRIKNPSKDENSNAQPLKNIGIITENLDFTVVDINGSYIGQEQSLFDLDNGEYIDVIVKLKPGLSMGSYSTNVIVTESVLDPHQPSVIKVTQDVAPGSGELYFEVDGNKESIKHIEGEEGALVSIKNYKIGGTLEPIKKGHLFKGWSYEERFVEGDFVTLKNGEMVLHAKFVKIDERADLTYKEDINIYVGESTEEEIINLINLKGSLKNFSNENIEIEVKPTFDENIINIPGVHEIKFFLKTKDMEEFIPSKKVAYLYVLNKPRLTADSRIIIDTNTIIPSNGSLWNPVGENEVANHILKSILKEPVKINFDIKELNQKKTGNQRVGFSMQYTDINGATKEMFKETFVTVIGVSVSDIEKTTDDSVEKVNVEENEEEINIVKKSTEEISLWDSAIIRLKNMEDTEIWSIEKSNYDDLGELKGNILNADESKNKLIVNTSEYEEPEIKKISKEVFSEINNHEKTAFIVINGNLTLSFNSKHINPVYKEEEIVEKYSINYIMEKNNDDFREIIKIKGNYIKLDLKEMDNFPLETKISVFLPEELSSSKALYLYEYLEEENRIRYKGRALNANCEAEFSLNNIAGIYVISEEFMTENISKTLTNNNINVEKTFKEFFLKENTSKMQKFVEKTLNLSFFIKFKNPDTFFTNNIIIFTAISGFFLSIIFIIKFLINWTRRK